MQHFTTTLSRQDTKLSRAKFRDNARTITTDEGAFTPQVVYVGGASQVIIKVGNLAHTNRVIAGTERLERVNEQMVYSVQRFSRKQRRSK